MNPTLRTRWIEALRSGSYRQAQGRLCVQDPSEPGKQQENRRYCCLGVLLDVARQLPDSSARFGYWDQVGNEDPVFIFDEDLVLNKELERAGNILHVAPYEEELIAMNDDQERSFSEIAQWIEDNIPEDK